MYIRKTLEVLREHKLYIRMTKWLLSNKEDYLGHNIGINGVKPDPSKMVWKQPKTRALWRFLGVQGLSPKVIQDFMKIDTSDELDSEENSLQVDVTRGGSLERAKD